ncbi:hypothetical protein Kisp02_23000 [Kineosporia sp. NBRC 101731]|nr:hypothetical protein Kisp02_23000 [Kineosporia sp. NBRC 101731]
MRSAVVRPIWPNTITIITPAISPAAISPIPGRLGDTNNKIMTLEPSAIGRYMSSVPRLPVGASGRTGGSCRDSSPDGISGGDCRAGRRKRVVVMVKTTCPGLRRFFSRARGICREVVNRTVGPGR